MRKLTLLILLLLFPIISLALTSEEYLQKGLTKSASGDEYGAITYYNKAIELNPQYSLSYASRALSKSSLGNNHGAIADFSKAIELNHKFSAAYYYRGILKLKMSDKNGCLDLSKAGELGVERAYEVIRVMCN